MKVYTRSEWNAPRAGDMTEQGPPTRAFLHHTDDPYGNEYDTLAKQKGKMRSIARFHMEVREWSFIGYHFIIFQYVGVKQRRIEPRVFEARPVKYVPAAQAGANPRTLAVCVVGNGVREKLYEETERVIANLIKRYPSVKVLGGHGDVTATSCPGAQFRRSIPEIARMAGVQVYR